MQKMKRDNTDKLSDPSVRRAILVLDRHDMEKRSIEGDTAVFRERECHVQPLEEFRAKETAVFLENIWDAGLARSGMVLVQSPYDLDVYEAIDEAPQKFALAKFMYFSTLCMYLGAKQVAVDQVEMRRDSEELHVDASGHVSAKGIKGKIEGSADFKDFQRFRSGLSLVDEFDGGEPDTEGAEKFLRSKHLFADPNMRTLLDMSRSTTNRLRRRKLILNLSSESKHNLGVAGRLEISAIASGGEVDAALEKKTKSSTEYILTVKVEF